MAPRILTLTVAFALSMLAAAAADKGEKKVDLSKIDLSKLPPPAAKTGVTYDGDVKAIFEKSCFKCHGPEKQKGKLRLDSLPAVLKGAKTARFSCPAKALRA